MDPVQLRHFLAKQQYTQWQQGDHHLNERDESDPMDQRLKQFFHSSIIRALVVGCFDTDAIPSWLCMTGWPLP